jgi:hypothetical protein
MCNCSRTLPQINAKPEIEQHSTTRSADGNSQSDAFIICMIIFGSIVFFVFIWASLFYLMKYKPIKYQQAN